MNYKIITKTVFAIFLISMVSYSCRKLEYDYIDGKTPDERYREYMEDVRNTLMNGSGWVGYLYAPTNMKAYTFYAEFTEKYRVVMYSDFADTSSYTPRESSYNLRNVGTPSLIFDTYNYIHMPADPDGFVNGGKNGEGLNSDYEFSILSYNQDTIRLSGNLNNSRMVFIRVEAAEKAKLQAGEFKNTISEFKDYLSSHKNSYIELPGGKQMGLNFSHADKIVSYSVQEDDGTVSDKSVPYFYSIKGAAITDDFRYKDFGLIGAKLENGELFAIGSDGHEYPVKQSAHPLTPLSASFSFNGTYTTIHIAGEQMPAGVSSDWGPNYYQKAISRFHPDNTVLGYSFILKNSSTVLMHIDYKNNSSGKENYAEAQYDYERNGDVITLTNYTPSDGVGNWKNRESTLREIIDYFNNRTFKIDWAEGTGGDVLGGLYPVDNPSSFFYGILQ